MATLRWARWASRLTIDTDCRQSVSDGRTDEARGRGWVRLMAWSRAWLLRRWALAVACTGAQTSPAC